ncbi:hypothetical protein [Streptomyces sp. NPDC001604]|uniref:hypothetical protein n=1 Tax=Streptomyces sp. NPDC001604 TaxID=3364593 RepID=UPI003686B3FD
MKRLNGQVWLMPRSPSFEPPPGDGARILSKVVGFLGSSEQKTLGDELGGHATLTPTESA